MRKTLLGFASIAFVAFAAGQVTAALAAPQQVSLDCHPVTEQWGLSYKSPGAYIATQNMTGYCYSYYLTSSIVNNGQVYNYSNGWSSGEHFLFPASGTTAVFSTHNTYRSWYNGYVGTSDY